MRTVAVITPVYATQENGRLSLFTQTIKSVLRQAYTNLIYIVVDDGSTVDVESLLHGYKEPRIRYLRRERLPADLQTASNALNLGIDYCLENTEEDLYAISFLHSDDLLTPNSLEIRLCHLGNGFVHTDMVTFNNEGVIGVQRRKIKLDITFPHGSHGNYHTIMWELNFLRYLKDFVARKYKQTGVFDSLLSYGEDRDVLLSSIEAAVEGGYSFQHVPSVSVYYRHHKQSITGELIDPNFIKAQIERISQKHFVGQEKRRPESLDRLLLDLPWSLGAFLPPGIKKELMPIRAKVKGQMFRFFHPKLARELETLFRIT